MSVMFLLVGASLVVAVGFLVAFIWSVKDGQYDDDYTPSIRMLFDNGLSSKKEIKETTSEITTEIAISQTKKNKSVSKKQK